jgi:hypothetical protein
MPHGSNKGKYYAVSCNAFFWSRPFSPISSSCPLLNLCIQSFNKAHGPRYKFWDVGVHPRNALPSTSRTPLRPPLRFLCADSHHETPSPPERQMCRMYTPRKCVVRDALLQGLRGLVTSHCRIHETCPTALSTSTRQILDAGLAEAAAAFPAPHRHQCELPHQRLARQQEAAARLAALTPLLPSPSIGQAEPMCVFSFLLSLQS